MLLHAGKQKTDPCRQCYPQWKNGDRTWADHASWDGSSDGGGQENSFPQAPKTKVYALYKPRNCITSLNDPEGRRTVKDFFPRDAGRLFPVGRLDYDAEGLLLLTNDGMLAHRLMHPNHKVWKSYFVKVKGMVSEQVLRTLRKGPKIRGENTSLFGSNHSTR